MIRKTMRIGEVRTSIKLEPEFWGYLKEVADGRSIRLSRLVNDVAHATPDRTNLASTLRTFSLIHARLRWQGLERELEKLMPATRRIWRACSMPARCPACCSATTGSSSVRTRPSSPGCTSTPAAWSASGSTI
jgi:predicted DNA-binding ribbon-helix-helix protein